MNCAKIKQEKRLFFLALFMAVGSLGRLGGSHSSSADDGFVAYLCGVKCNAPRMMYVCLYVCVPKSQHFTFLGLVCAGLSGVSLMNDDILQIS